MPYSARPGAQKRWRRDGGKSVSIAIRIQAPGQFREILYRLHAGPDKAAPETRWKRRVARVPRLTPGGDRTGRSGGSARDNPRAPPRSRSMRCGPAKVRPSATAASETALSGLQRFGTVLGEGGSGRNCSTPWPSAGRRAPAPSSLRWAVAQTSSEGRSRKVTSPQGRQAQGRCRPWRRHLDGDDAASATSRT